MQENISKLPEKFRQYAHIVSLSRLKYNENRELFYCCEKLRTLTYLILCPCPLSATIFPSKMNNLKNHRRKNVNQTISLANYGLVRYKILFEIEPKTRTRASLSWRLTHNLLFIHYIVVMRMWTLFIHKTTFIVSHFR